MNMEIFYFFIFYFNHKSFLQQDECSSTAPNSYEFSWWTVDMKESYTVTEVCLLNVGDHNRLYTLNFSHFKQT